MDSRFEMVVVFAMFGLCVGLAAAQLSSTYYDSSCPNLQSTVKAAVKSAVAKEKRMGASLLRLHFHDCFVNGCDASILLDDSSTVTGEKSAVPNANSVRGFDVIDDIKSQVESICSGVVSCSDILAIAARDSVVELGGPTWTVQLGRRDATSASLSGANTNIPGPTSNVSTLISKFSAQGLSTTDMVALSGSHTIGQARCKSFRSRIYDNTSTEAISSSYAKYLQKNCSSTSGGSDDDNLAPLDPGTATYFDGSYYTHVKSLMGLLHSDQDLYSGDSSETQSMIKNYASSSSKFFSDFTAAMLNMGNISPLTGSSGEIRTNCRQPNSSS